MDTQLEEEIYTNGYNQSGDRTTIWHYNNCNEPRYNTRIYKKNEEISNIYSSDWFQLILGVIMN